MIVNVQHGANWYDQCELENVTTWKEGEKLGHTLSDCGYYADSILECSEYCDQLDIPISYSRQFLDGVLSGIRSTVHVPIYQGDLIWQG